MSDPVECETPAGNSYRIPAGQECLVSHEEMTQAEIDAYFDELAELAGEVEVSSTTLTRDEPTELAMTGVDSVVLILLAAVLVAAGLAARMLLVVRQRWSHQER